MTVTQGRGPDRVERATPGASRPLSLLQLYALRAGYLLMGIGLAVVHWPKLAQHAQWSLFEGVVECMLLALSVLALAGVRHPTRMLPVLLFECAWKLTWLAVVALPRWRAHTLDAPTRETASACLWVVLIVAVVPWRRVAAYLAAPGDPWRPGRQPA